MHAYGGMGKRYIFSTSNTIFPGMPPESYRIMLDEIERYAGAGLFKHKDTKTQRTNYIEVWPFVRER